MPAKLTEKQKLFVEEYLKDLNATAAAKRAGYSEDTAGSIGHENLNKPEIRDAVIEANQQRLERTRIDADYVLDSLKVIAERCMQRQPVMVQRGKEWVQATDEDGKNIWRFDANGANTALTALGKHLKLFTEKFDVSGRIDGKVEIAVSRVDLDERVNQLKEKPE